MSSKYSYEITHVDDSDESAYFRHLYGRKLNSMNKRYLLPADSDELRRSDIQHRMLQFVLGGKNHVGPINEVLRARDGKQRRVLDFGTGGGEWAIDIADEFPRVEITGVDLAPVQPRRVPPNCTFELCDLDQWDLPYPSHQFDVIHARSMHTGIRNYPRFIKEISRLLRPGGLVILVEQDLRPLADGRLSSEIGHGHSSGLPGWFALWNAYQRCLKKQGVDTTVPQRLADLLEHTNAFDVVIEQQGNVPIGSWPQDPLLLTVGQLAWMGYDLFLPALRPLFHSCGLPAAKVDDLIDKAFKDLYYPLVHPSSRYYIVHAIKKS